jgi:hypothetical protein
MNPAPPHFAMGGIVAAGAPGRVDRVAVDLSFGGQGFEMVAARAVADKLLEHSRRLAMTSGGTKPTSYR